MKSIVFLLLLATAPLAAAQSFPAKPIRVIVPSPPGDGSDVMARLIGEKLTAAWGQQVVVDNRPGAGGRIGTEAAAKAPADGATPGSWPTPARTASTAACTATCPTIWRRTSPRSRRSCARRMRWW